MYQILNKEISSKFPEGYPDWQAPDEGQKAQQPKRCDNNKLLQHGSLKSTNDLSFQRLSTEGCKEATSAIEYAIIVVK